MNITNSSSTILLFIVFFLISRFQYLDYANNYPSAQASGLAALHAGLIFLYYLAGKFIVEDGKYRTKTKVLWIMSDKIVLPIAVIYLATRNNLTECFSTSSFWLLLAILMDPIGLIGKTISESSAITSGFFLRGVVVGERHSAWDYLVVIVVLVLMYLMILRH